MVLIFAESIFLEIIFAIGFTKVAGLRVNFIADSVKTFPLTNTPEFTGAIIIEITFKKVPGQECYHYVFIILI